MTEDTTPFDDDTPDYFTNTGINFADFWPEYRNTLDNKSFTVITRFDRITPDGDRTSVDVNTTFIDGSIHEHRTIGDDKIVERYARSDSDVILSRTTHTRHEQEYFAQYDTDVDDIIHHIRPNSIPTLILAGCKLSFTRLVDVDNSLIGLEYDIRGFVDTNTIDFDAESTLLQDVHNLDTNTEYAIDGTVTVDKHGYLREISYNITDGSNTANATTIVQPTQADAEDISWVDKAKETGLRIVDVHADGTDIAFTVDNGTIRSGWTITIEISGTAYQTTLDDAEFDTGETVHLSIEDNTLHVNDTAHSTDTDSTSTSDVRISLMGQHGIPVYMNTFEPTAGDQTTPTET